MIFARGPLALPLRALPLLALPLLAVPLLALSACATHAAPEPAPMAASAYDAAVADASRTAADRADDAMRHPAEMLALAQVRPGMAVVDIMPGGGYFSRLFAAAVGDAGRVMLYVPAEFAASPYKPLQRAQTVMADTANPVLTLGSFPMAGPLPAGQAGRYDVVWTSRNYHDFHLVPGFDAMAYNRMVLDLLKPGGVYVVVDHQAPAGSGKSSAGTTHRIEGAFVRREVESAGFVFDAESTVLANPADDGTRGVFDAELKGHTNQFAMRFRKPG